MEVSHGGIPRYHPAIHRLFPEINHPAIGVAPFQETPLYGPKDVSKHPLLNHVFSAGFEVGDDCWCFGWPEAPPQTAGSVERQTSDWKKGFNMVQYIWLHMVNHVFRMKNYGNLFWSVHVPSSILNWNSRCCTGHDIALVGSTCIIQKLGHEGSVYITYIYIYSTTSHGPACTSGCISMVNTRGHVCHQNIVWWIIRNYLYTILL